MDEQNKRANLAPETAPLQPSPISPAAPTAMPPVPQKAHELRNTLLLVGGIVGLMAAVLTGLALVVIFQIGLPTFTGPSKTFSTKSFTPYAVNDRGFHFTVSMTTSEKKSLDRPPYTPLAGKFLLLNFHVANNDTQHTYNFYTGSATDGHVSESEIAAPNGNLYEPITTGLDSDYCTIRTGTSCDITVIYDVPDTSWNYGFALGYTKDWDEATGDSWNLHLQAGAKLPPLLSYLTNTNYPASADTLKQRIKDGTLKTFNEPAQVKPFTVSLSTVVIKPYTPPANDPSALWSPTELVGAHLVVKNNAHITLALNNDDLGVISRFVNFASLGDTSIEAGADSNQAACTVITQGSYCPSETTLIAPGATTDIWLIYPTVHSSSGTYLEVFSPTDGTDVLFKLN